MKRWMKITGAMLLLFLVAFSWIVADVVTRPQNVHLKAHIRICRLTENGAWVQFDQVGPSVVTFSANLFDLSAAKRVNTQFTWTARSNNGSDYSVRLARTADLNYSLSSGQLEGIFPLDITYGGKRVIVNGRSTTETLNSPLGPLKGKRAKGVFGVQPSEFTFVSSNDFQIPGEPLLKLVCIEEYRLTPGK